MTQDQCIEIAEKVWGWDKSTLIFNGYPLWRNLKSSEDGIWEDALPKEVLSWTGFGRTVEGMVGYQFIAKGDGCGFCKKPIRKHEIVWHNYDYSNRDRTELIEATHLAALDAIKNNSK